MGRNTRGRLDLMTEQVFWLRRRLSFLANTGSKAKHCYQSSTRDYKQGSVYLESKFSHHEDPHATGKLARMHVITSNPQLEAVMIPKSASVGIPISESFGHHPGTSVPESNQSGASYSFYTPFVMTKFESYFCHFYKSTTTRNPPAEFSRLSWMPSLRGWAGVSRPGVTRSDIREPCL